MDYKHISERIALLTQEIRDLQRMNEPYSTHEGNTASQIGGAGPNRRTFSVAHYNAISRPNRELACARIEA